MSGLAGEAEVLPPTLVVGQPNMGCDAVLAAGLTRDTIQELTRVSLFSLFFSDLPCLHHRRISCRIDQAVN